MTGEGVAMWLGESSLTEVIIDDNGNAYVSYVLAESDQKLHQIVI